LPELAKICYLQLKDEITVDNAIERLFHPCCRENKDLRDIYLDYLAKNYEKAKVKVIAS
jgi:hypothetical protein